MARGTYNKSASAARDLAKNDFFTVHTSPKYGHIDIVYVNKELLYVYAHAMAYANGNTSYLLAPPAGIADEVLNTLMEL